MTREHNSWPEIIHPPEQSLRNNGEVKLKSFEADIRNY